MKCKICGKDYPATAKYFGRRATYPGGLAYKCRKCERKHQRAYRAKKVAENPDYWRDKEVKRKLAMASDPAYAERRRTARRNYWKKRYAIDPKFTAKQRERARARKRKHG